MNNQKEDGANTSLSEMDTTKYILSEIDEEEYIKAAHNIYNSIDTFIRKERIIKREDNLVLILKNKERIFNNKPVEKYETDAEEYEYIGFFPKIEKYLVVVTYWEGENILLVDKNSGQIDTLNGYPYLSPGGKQIVSVSGGCQLEGVFCGLSLYKIGGNNNKPKELISVVMDSMPPVEYIWISENEGYVKVYHIDEMYNNNNGISELSSRFHYYKIRFK